MRAVARTLLSAVAVSASLLSGASCSRINVPSFEDIACSEAREELRTFYSVHFDGDMTPTKEKYALKRSRLTDDFVKRIGEVGRSKRDPFTLTEDYPRTFKLGTCEASSSNRVSIQVQLLWRDAERTEQKAVEARMVKTGDRWLIDDVSEGN